MKRYFIFITIFILLFFSQFAHAQNSGDYRTIASGNWSDLTIWQQFDGMLWNPPTFYPGQTTAIPLTVTTIQTGHTVALDVSPANEIVNFTISAGATLNLSVCNILQYSGILTNNGTTTGTQGQLAILTTGAYRSVVSGNWTIPTNWQKYNGFSWAGSADYPGQNAPLTNQRVFIRNGNNMTANIALAHTVGGLVVYAGGTVTNGAAPYIIAPTFQSCGTVTETIINTLLVVNTNDAGAGSLRQAITDANNLTGADVINFAIIGAGVQTINLSSPLPVIGEQVTIDGWTQTGWTGSPLIEVTGIGSGSGLWVQANNCIIRGLTLNNHSTGVYFLSVTGGTLQGCYLGTNNTGTGATPNTSFGVLIDNSTGVLIGGSTATTRNIISGNGTGIQIGTGSANQIKGNYIGTDVNGTTAIANTGYGILLWANTSGNFIGGTAAGEGNVISGNGNIGIGIDSSTGNFIQGNLIGTNASGTGAIPNVNDGIYLQNNANNNTIGGTTASARNIISGNGSNGIILISSTGNTIQGNYIGTDVNGTIALGNINGMVLSNANNNTIGGTTTNARNIISGNGSNGIILSLSTGNTIQGNYIGTDVSGTGNLGHGSTGIITEINTSGNTIGGTTAGTGNIIAFNNYAGLIIKTGCTNTPILGNSIFSNAVLGIDLNDNGSIDPNDTDDPDIGANNLQNFPEFTGLAVLSGSTVNLTYKVPSTTANSSYPLRIEFFRADAGRRQGHTFLGFDTYSLAEANANKTLATFTPVVTLNIGDRIVATATDANGNTSEFSAEVGVGLAGAGLHTDDYAALVALYNATNGANWTDKTNWFVDGDAANWFGITTDGTPPSATRRVTRIILDQNNLVGTLPTELGNLPSLQVLYITRNTISGGIPTTIGNLINLQTLNLSNNQELTGGVPTQIGNLTNLQILDLSGNKLNSITTTVGALSGSLREFYMARNLLTSLPNELWTLTALQKLALDNNQITGMIPATVSQLASIQELYLHFNKFSGVIPNTLGDISSLTTLYLNDNLFVDMQDFSSKTTFNPSTFTVENNKLEFDDLKPNISKLTNYSPQAKIGTPQNVTVNVGASQTLTVSTPQPVGTTNSYQWYLFDGFNFNTISGATSTSYTINNYNPMTDAGIYNCQVTNDGLPLINGKPSLILQSENFTIATNANGVFQQDYDALVDFYNATSGANWTNKTNWLSTADVSTWFGVTVENNRVTEIRLPNNNLIGDEGSTLQLLTALKLLDLGNNALTGIDLSFDTDNVFERRPFEVIHLNNNQLTENIGSLISNLQYYTSTLKSVDLSNNQFSGSFRYDDISNYSNIQPINLPNFRGFNLSNNEITNATGQFVNTPKILNSVLNVSNNRLRFTHLAAFINFYANSSQYAPQKTVWLNPKTVFGITGQPFSYSNINLTVTRAGCTVTQQWFKLPDLVTPVDTTFNLAFNPFTVSDTGRYVMKATATCVPNLELITETLTIKLAPSTFTVDNNSDIDDGNYDVGNLTLREAIKLANQINGNCTIGFNLSSNNLVINLNSANAYQDISQPNIVIDGTTQPNYIDEPLVVIDGGNSVAQAFNIISTGCKIYGLEIKNFSNQGIRQSVNNANFQIGDIDKGNYIHDNGNNGILTFGTLGNIVGNTISGNNTNGIAIQGVQNGNNITIENNNIGTDLSGTTVSGTQQTGISVQGSFGSSTLRIGSVGKGNIIGGHSNSGIDVSNIFGVNISGNYIGTNQSGASLGNAVGINAGVPVGSFTIDANVVSANSGSGIVISHGSFHQISNNKIGTNPAGTAVLGNGLHGLYYGGGNGGNIVNNLISGNNNGAGIFMTVVTMTPNNTQIYSNKIGTDISGSYGIPNLEGIRINGGANNNFIGTIANATNSNTIAYNTNVGIVIDQAGTDNNLIGQNAIFCNGGVNADRGIQITNGANGGIESTFPPTPSLTVTLSTYSCLATPAVTLSGNLSLTLPTTGDFEVYRVDESCPNNQGKTYVGSFPYNSIGPLWSATVFLSTFQLGTSGGKGTFVLLSRDASNNTSMFSNTFDVYNRPTIVSIKDLSYPDCKVFNPNITITLSDDSPDGTYYVDFGSGINETLMQFYNHKSSINSFPAGFATPFDFLTVQLRQPDGTPFPVPPCSSDNPSPYPLTPNLGIPTGTNIPPPAVLGAVATNATRCDVPNGKLTLSMQNVQTGRDYYIDIDGDGKTDFGPATAGNNQIVVDNIPDGTEITSITVTQPLLQCESNTFSFAYSYPILPLPDATLLVYADLAFVDKGQKTKVIIEESEADVNYQLERTDTDELIDKPVDGNGGIIELPTEVLTSTLTYRVLAKNKISGCSTLLETSATIGVDNKCITEADSLILVDLYRNANGPNWFGKWDLFSPACTWFGVEIRGDRVTGLRLVNNNVSGRLPVSLVSLSKLTFIDVSSNALDFTAIEPMVSIAASRNIPFFYSPQAEIYANENIKAFQGKTVRISSLTGGSANKYQWFKEVNNRIQKLANGGNINGATAAILEISNVTIADEGIYFCEVSSPIATELILTRADVRLSVIPQLSPQDLQALIRFYNAVGGPKWKKPWDLNQDVSTWEGLVFENGNLLQINLPNNNLTGDIPDVFDAEIFEDLTYINLSNNFLVGKLPPSLQKLQKLTYLDLSQNDLTGEVEAWISNLQSLVTLWLSYNRIRVVNGGVGNLVNLRNLFLNNNDIEVVPTEIGFLTNLEILNLSDNLLEEIPETIGNLEKLKYLNVSGNYLEYLPNGVTLLDALEQLHAYDNFIEDLPQELSLLANLQVFTIDFNNLDFGTLEPLVDAFKKSLPKLDFIYAPQAPIGTEQEFDIPLGSPIILEIKTAGQNNTYQWYKDGKLITGATNAIFRISNASREDAGLYYVFVSNRTANKLILRSFAYTIRTNCVGSTERLEIEVRGNALYCDIEPVNTILVAPAGSNIAGYQWLLNGVRIANASADRLTAREVGNYAVNVISRENCINTTPAVSIRRFTPPQVSITASRDLLTASTQANVRSYEWFLNGNPISNVVSQQFEVTQSGRYTVRITDANGCRGSSAVFNHILVSSEEDFFVKGFKIYPNPTSNMIFVESRVEKITKIQIYEVTGRQASTKIEQLQTQQFSLDISNFAVGTYLLEIQTDKGVHFKKIVKQ